MSCQFLGKGEGFSMNNADIKPFFEGAIVTAFTTLIVPVLDVARVMWVRLKNGKPLFQPDRNHIHHRFLDLGIPHHKTMLYIIVLAVFFSLFNIISVQFISNNIVLALDVVFWGVFHLVFYRVEKRKKAGKTTQVPRVRPTTSRIRGSSEYELDTISI